MFPVLTVMYVKLARTAEQDARAAFGDAYDRYAAEVPGLFPKLSRISARNRPVVIATVSGKVRTEN